VCVCVCVCAATSVRGSPNTVAEQQQHPRGVWLQWPCELKSHQVTVITFLPSYSVVLHAHRKTPSASTNHLSVFSPPTTRPLCRHLFFNPFSLNECSSNQHLLVGGCLATGSKEEWMQGDSEHNIYTISFTNFHINLEEIYVFRTKVFTWKVPAKHHMLRMLSFPSEIWWSQL